MKARREATAGCSLREKQDQIDAFEETQGHSITFTIQKRINAGPGLGNITTDNRKQNDIKYRKYV